MTVLQMSGADAEGTRPPPSKKRRFSQNQIEQREQRFCDKIWLTSNRIELYENSYLMPAAPSTMVNDYGSSDTFPHTVVEKSHEENGHNDSVTPIVPLLNLGNTCFLNSVLYTLRFAPSFLHKLHHLSLAKRRSSNKADRGCSLSRNLGKSGSWSNKDAFSYSAECSESKIQTVISKLHHLYATLCCNESKDRMEPYQPNTFLQSLREVNPIFEGNQQHDAHELLVCLLDIIREACELTHQEKPVTAEIAPEIPAPASYKNSTVKKITQKFMKKVMRTKWNHSDGDIKKYLKNGNTTTGTEDDYSYTDERDSPIPGTIFDDFRGVSLLQTKCLECEQITERKETFCDICVPILTTEDSDNQEAVNNLYQSIIVTEEYLIDNNKYWCESCCRYNEARRCVKYEKLPRLLTLHLKRFSSNYGASVAKVNDHMPTPFTLPCFCEECLNTAATDERPPHSYTLYGIIMHLGATIASGHYVSFVKILDSSQDYLVCTRDKPKTSSLPRGTTPTKCEFSGTSDTTDKQTSNGTSRGLFKPSSKSFNGGSASPSVSREMQLRARMTSNCKGLGCCNIRLRGLPMTDEEIWLECDDETIRVLKTRELADMLSPRSSKSTTVTPYLLFYAKTDS